MELSLLKWQEYGYFQTQAELWPLKTGPCSCCVTGSSVHKPAAGNVRYQLLEVQLRLFGYFELKAMIAAVPAA
ncbi:hypothetical protein I6M57_15910 [Shewanella algae]|uniref:hypothetical protein n=1 Tax=Shewanella algae TaxID=38313 RepID=UPI001AAF0E46|nr:hypothetical protein [Shewanella algae]MBO2578722.1 hypothetical protein [Shewanella algae]MBO2684565.1 hypothetical protein [Shewanella algae]